MRDPSRERSLLARAYFLLVTSCVAETSSLVAMEALSCGTPVVAFRQGALPEIVDDGETGFIVHSPDEMARAIAQAGHLSRRLCRERAIERFDSRRMIEDYLALYRRMVTRRFPRARRPKRIYRVHRREENSSPRTLPHAHTVSPGAAARVRTQMPHRGDRMR